MLGLCNGQGIFLLTQICDLVLGFLILNRPGTFIKSSNDLRGLMPVPNKKRKDLGKDGAKRASIREERRMSRVAFME